MVRSNLTRLVLAGALTLMAACSAADQSVAPLAKQTRPIGAPSPDVIMDFVAPDSLSVDFTVTPSGGMFVLGKHAVFFPDHGICDPATSSYGPGEWDAPCTPLDAPIRFHAEVRGSPDGETWIDFTPAVRFVPTDDPNRTVWVMMKVGADVTADNYQGFGMLWMPNGSTTELVNEAATDSSLKTYIDLERDVVFRRVKHFSGYLVGSTIEASDDLLSAIVPLY